jgi:hypothetical protein
MTKIIAMIKKSVPENADYSKFLILSACLLLLLCFSVIRSEALSASGSVGGCTIQAEAIVWYGG